MEAVGVVIAWSRVLGIIEGHHTVVCRLEYWDGIGSISLSSSWSVVHSCKLWLPRCDGVCY